MKNYFAFFSNVILTVGNKRTLVIDIQRQRVFYISNNLVKFIKNGKINLKLLDSFSLIDKEVIEKWLNYFIDNNLGHYTNHQDMFPQMNMNFDYPGLISNAIIEVSHKNSHLLTQNLYHSLNNLGAKAIIIIYIDNCFEINQIYNYYKSSDIEYIELYLPAENFDNSLILEISSHKRVRKITFYGMSNKKESIVKDSLVIDFLENKIDLMKSCGNIFLNNTLINKDVISESLSYNSCLHKKIAINREGTIKNCLSMPQSFGNIKTTTLEEALSHHDFKKYWSINKDMIATCKDCEFRHICTDCRAYTERTHFEGEIDLSKPLKCGYNPYTNEWEDWSTNTLKEKAIEYYGMQELITKDV
ncbi:grasp-with-spasm system SPASM domain peptide maturase [Flavobacterium tegetincola]|uniref:grasp-with-spasm system SPASM domain peptide maturase n=1 Tax=Flavobacterium tegetincola TaxID=150172 RepID=UPI0003F94E62|nr:grasp-with-spasm system SPASM domain peptide maturase [Flavobacterium tegetincola]